MPKVKANQITINYEQQGTGEPLLLIPYLAADNACYAFQVADYAKALTCIAIDPRRAGDSDKPPGVWSTELFADDDFEDFFERTQPAGGGDEGVAAVFHEFFAVTHRRRDD